MAENGMGFIQTGQGFDGEVTLHSFDMDIVLQNNIKSASKFWYLDTDGDIGILRFQIHFGEGMPHNRIPQRWIPTIVLLPYGNKIEREMDYNTLNTDANRSITILYRTSRNSEDPNDEDDWYPWSNELWISNSQVAKIGTYLQIQFTFTTTNSALEPPMLIKNFSLKYNTSVTTPIAQATSHALNSNYTNIDAHAIVDLKYLVWEPEKEDTTAFFDARTGINENPLHHDFQAIDVCKLRDDCILVAKAIKRTDNSYGIKIYAVNPLNGDIISYGGTPCVSSDLTNVEPTERYDYGWATSGGASTITDSNKAWTTNALAGMYVEITAGRGVGQIRTIASNTATAITTTVAWTIQPNKTSQFIVKNPKKICRCDKTAPIRINYFWSGALWVTYRSADYTKLISLRGTLNVSTSDALNQTNVFYPERKLANRIRWESLVVVDAPITKTTLSGFYTLGCIWKNSSGKFVSGDEDSFLNTEQIWPDTNTAAVTLLSQSNFKFEKISGTNHARFVMNKPTGYFSIRFTGKTIKLPLYWVPGLTGTVKFCRVVNGVETILKTLPLTSCSAPSINFGYFSTHTLKVYVITDTNGASNQTTKGTTKFGIYDNSSGKEIWCNPTSHFPVYNTSWGSFDTKWNWQGEQEGYLELGMRADAVSKGTMYYNGDYIGYRINISDVVINYADYRYFTQFGFRFYRMHTNKHFKPMVLTDAGIIQKWNTGTDWEDDIFISADGDPKWDPYFYYDLENLANSTVTYNGATSGLGLSGSKYGKWIEFRFYVCNLVDGQAYDPSWWLNSDLGQLIGPLRVVWDTFSCVNKHVCNLATNRVSFSRGSIDFQNTYDHNPNLIFNDAYVTTLYDEVNKDFIRKGNLVGYWNGYWEANAGGDTTNSDGVVGFIHKYGSATEAMDADNQIDFDKTCEDGQVADIPGADGAVMPYWRPWITSSENYWDFRGWWNESGAPPNSINCVAWVMTYVYSPSTADYCLLYSADDGIEIYLQDAEGLYPVTLPKAQTGNIVKTGCIATIRPTWVSGAEQGHKLKTGEYKAHLPLKLGWNKLFFKVANGASPYYEWKFRATICEWNYNIEPIAPTDNFPYGMVLNTEPYPVNESAIIAWQTKSYRAAGHEFRLNNIYPRTDEASGLVLNDGTIRKYISRVRIGPYGGAYYYDPDAFQAVWDTNDDYGNIFSVTFDAYWNFTAGWQGEVYLNNGDTHSKIVVEGHGDDIFYGQGFKTNLIATCDGDLLASSTGSNGAKNIGFIMRQVDPAPGHYVAEGAGTEGLDPIGCFFEIRNVRINFIADVNSLDTSVGLWTYIWTNLGGEVLDWQSLLQNTLHTLWFEKICPYAERLSFLEWFGSLWCYHQSWSAGQHKLNITSLDNSNMNLSNDGVSPNWTTMCIYRDKVGTQDWPVFTNLNWDYSNYGKFYISANKRQLPSTDIDGGFLHTFHPTWLDQRVWFNNESGTKELMVGFFPYKDVMCAVSIKPDGRLYRRFSKFTYDTVDVLGYEDTLKYIDGEFYTLDKAHSKPVHFSDYITRIEFNRSLLLGESNGSFDINNTEGLFNLHPTNDQKDITNIRLKDNYRKIIPDQLMSNNTWDRQPRLVSFYMSSHPDYIDPYFKTYLNPSRWGHPEMDTHRSDIEPKRVFTGIMGQLEQNTAWEDASIQANVYDYGYQLQKYCTPETLVYAAPTQVFIDNFADEYILDVSKSGLIQKQGLNTTLWPTKSAGSDARFKVEAIEKYLQHQNTNTDYITSKGFVGSYDACFCFEICLDSFKINDDFYGTVNQPFTIGWAVSSGLYSKHIYFNPQAKTATVFKKHDHNSSTIAGTFKNVEFVPGEWTRVVILVRANAINLFINDVRNPSTVITGGHGSGTTYAFTWEIADDAKLRNPRIEDYRANDTQKTDFWIVQHVVNQASQCNFPVEFVVDESDKDAMVGFQTWAVGTSAADFISTIAKRYNKVCYFDRRGRFVWKRQRWDRPVCTKESPLKSEHIASIRLGYSNFDYTNWVSVYSDAGENKPIQQRYGDAYSIVNDGIRFKFIDDSSIKTTKDASLRAMSEFFGDVEGLESLSISLERPFLELNPGDILCLNIPEVGLFGTDSDMYIVTSINVTYEYENGMEISLELDSRLKAQRQLVSDQITSTYLGLKTEDEKTTGSVI